MTFAQHKFLDHCWNKGNGDGFLFLSLKSMSSFLPLSHQYRLIYCLFTFKYVCMVKKDYRRQLDMSYSTLSVNITMGLKHQLFN